MSLLRIVWGFLQPNQEIVMAEVVMEEGERNKRREKHRIMENWKMGQFYQTETCPKSWPRHGQLVKKKTS